MPNKQCLDNIKKLGPDARYCDDPYTFCDDMRELLHKVCTCQPPYSHSGPCPYTPASPILAFDNKGPCYCCCSGGTLVAIDGEQMGSMEELVPGDTIYTASVHSTTQNLVWTTSSVEFSQGVAGEHIPALMVKFLRDGDDEEFLIVTGKHLFYMPNGTLRRAETLVPGLDVLLMSDGTQVSVTGLSTALVRSIHHIATSREPAMSVDNHLISIKGVVCGDYALQISGFGRDTDIENVRPVFGTAEYLQRYSKHIVIDSLGVKATSTSVIQIPTVESLPGFIAEGNESGMVMPIIIQTFFTQQQALDIFNTAFLNQQWQYPPSSLTVKMANNLLQTYGEVYPDISFGINLTGDGNISVNSYAMTVVNQKYLVVCAGLLSLDTIEPGALAIIIAHGVALLNSSKQPGCMGQADYDSIGIVSTVWNTFNDNGFIPDAISQLDSLFQMIIPASDQNGTPGNACQSISTDCRLETMYAAFNELPLPACANGTEL